MTDEEIKTYVERKLKPLSQELSRFQLRYFREDEARKKKIRKLQGTVKELKTSLSAMARASVKAAVAYSQILGIVERNKLAIVKLKDKVKSVPKAKLKIFKPMPKWRRKWL